jgi:protein-S-isoprenylcysteine O-methyltransferase Ste14
MKLFRTARAASPTHNVIKTVASIVVTWGLALAVLPMLVVWLERRLEIAPLDIPGHRLGAAVLFVGGCVLGLSSAWFMATIGNGTPLPFDAAAKLVVVGPYRYVRNPMAIGGIGQSIAVALYRGSYSALAYSILAGILWHALIRPPEEQFLATQFGLDYEEYCTAVKLWIPRVKPFLATSVN